MSASNGYDAPICDLDAETQVLGGILQDPSLFSGVDLNSSDFQNDAYQLIFSVMGELRRESKPIDVALLQSRLKEMTVEGSDALKHIGGAATLGKIINSVATAAHTPHFAKHLRVGLVILW